jgi:hypothetical protein
MSIAEQIIGIAVAALLPIIVIYAPVGMLCVRVKSKLLQESGFSIQAFFPVWNLLFLRKMLYNRTTLVKIPAIALAVAILFRWFSIIMLVNLPVLAVYSSAILILALVVHYVTYIIVAIDVANAFGSSFLTYIICVLVTPLAYYLLYLKVTPYIESCKETIDGTFEGR